MLQERLKNQKQEAASNPEYGSSYKPKASKEAKQAKRKEILSNIGETCMLFFVDSGASSNEPYKSVYIESLLYDFIVQSCTVASC